VGPNAHPADLLEGAAAAAARAAAAALHKEAHVRATMPECPTVSTPGRRLAGWLARRYLLFLQDSEELRVLSAAQIVDDLQRHLGPNLSMG
jgi:plasmid stabilization system protein ParE